MEIRFISSTHVRAMADAELPLPVARALDLSGRVLGSRYSLRRRIGGGSMGTVYEARDMTLGTAVAVKVLHPDYAGDADFRRRFHQEALLGARMRHEHSVAVTDLGETDDGLFYSVMEYLEGESLDGLLSSSQGPLPWRRVVTITVQVCAALQAAHERGVIHRDIKPGNCFLVRREGRGGREDDDPNFTYVKVLDLGLARLMPAGGRPTPPGRLGAPEYLAPEQVQGFTCDHRVDLYAIGVMMYKLLTRRLPFTGDSPAAIMKMHIEATPAPPRRAAPGADIPASLEAVVLRALAKSPADRFPDAKLMAEAVRAAAAEAEAEAVAIDESLEEAPTLGRLAGLSANSGSRSTIPGASTPGASTSGASTSRSSASRAITSGAAASGSSSAAASRSSGAAASRAITSGAAASRSSGAAASRSVAHPGTPRLPHGLLGLLLALASILVVALTTLVDQRAEQQRALARIEPPPVPITAPTAQGAALPPSPTTLAASAAVLASPSTAHAATEPTLAAPAHNGTAFASALAPTPASRTTGLAEPTAEPATASSPLPSLASPSLASPSLASAGPGPRHGLSERTAPHDAAASPRTPGTPSERVFQRLADTVAPGVYRCMQRHAPGQGVLTVELTVGGPRRSAVALGLREHDSPDLRGCLAPLLARLSFPPTEHTARYAHVYKP